VIRVWLGFGLAALLLSTGWLSYRTAYRTGWEAGRAEITAQWAKNAAQREKAHSEALAAADDTLRRQLAARDEVERGLSDRLATADARGRTLADRLRDALAAPRSCPVPSTAVPSPGADGAGREPGNSPALGAALADHFAACERDARRLTELQDWVR